MTMIPTRTVFPPEGTLPDEWIHRIDDGDTERLVVDGHAEAYGTEGGMPRELQIIGDLTVDCVAAGRIPHRTSVGGTLRVVGSSDWGVVLPAGLSVGDDLDLRGADAAFRIPPGLHVGADVLIPRRAVEGDEA